MDEVSTARVNELIETTLIASPWYKRAAVNYRVAGAHPRLRATAQLILRDTLKVTGTDDMPPPTAGIFYVHPADPGRGGTGHTIRVCRRAKVSPSSINSIGSPGSADPPVEPALPPQPKAKPR